MSEPKKMPPCHVCGAVPCFGICPMVDPYAGDRFAEHQDHEAGAIHDDVRERFSGEGAAAAASGAPRGAVRGCLR